MLLESLVKLPSHLNPIIINWPGVVLREWRRMSGELFDFCRSVMSNCLQPHGLQHTSLPCPSPTPGAYSNSCRSSQCCHPTFWSSVVFFSRLQSFPASKSFTKSQFLPGGQSIGDSASASVLPVDIQDWFPLGWTGLIFLTSRDSKESFPTPQFKSFNSLELSFL